MEILLANTQAFADFSKGPQNDSEYEIFFDMQHLVEVSVLKDSISLLG